MGDVAIYYFSLHCFLLGPTLFRLVYDSVFLCNLPWRARALMPSDFDWCWPAITRKEEQCNTSKHLQVTSINRRYARLTSAGCATPSFRNMTKSIEEPYASNCNTVNEHTCPKTQCRCIFSRVTHVPARTLKITSINWRYARLTSVAPTRAVRRCFICGVAVSPGTPGRPLSRLCSYLANDAPLHGLGTTYIFRYEPTACMCTSSPASSDS